MRFLSLGAVDVYAHKPVLIIEANVCHILDVDNFWVGRHGWENQTDLFRRELDADDVCLV